MDARPIVNLSSVPQRSPFRYPGGKTWLVPRIRQWLTSLPERPALFIEPFAGGGIVSLTVAAERLAKHVIMVELDSQVAAVWKTALDVDDSDWLIQKIMNFKLTPENVSAEISKRPRTTKTKAFQTILKNRIHRGGILANGSGMLKQGENGKGIGSRWYPHTLSKRISAITAMRNRITFIQGDGLKIMRQYASCPDTASFIDPPYTAAGKRAGRRLYTHYDLDHEALFKHAGDLKGDFLMTYDDADSVRALATEHGFETELVFMKNTHHTQMTELLIGHNLEQLCDKERSLFD